MERISISIQPGKKQLFLEFLKTLTYVKVEKDEGITVPKSHQKFVLNRIDTAKPKDYISLGEFKKRIRKAKRAK